MGSLLSTIKPKTPSSTTEKTTTSTMGSSAPETFKHYANAQTEFTKTLPLIGNENAFLGDIFTSYAFPSYPLSPLSSRLAVHIAFFFKHPRSQFDPANPEFFTCSDRKDNPISSGFYRLDPGTPLVYTYTYDEMKIIVDGDFEISDQSGQSVKAKKGDVFFFPKGSVITFKTEKGGLGFYCGQRGKDTA